VPRFIMALSVVSIVFWGPRENWRRRQARRKDHVHQVTAELVGRRALIVTENPSIKNMTASAKGTADKPGKNVKTGKSWTLRQEVS
jgi:transposase